MGDFNEILNNAEDIGGPERHASTFQPFTEMITVYGMTELAKQGNEFTWAGKRGDWWIQCCLDRCFGNIQWHNLFPISNQIFLKRLGSDHRPVFVRLLMDNEVKRGQFRFDQRCADDPSFKDVIAETWNNEILPPTSFVMDRISICRKRYVCGRRRNLQASKIS